MRILKLLLPITSGLFLALYLLVSNVFLQKEDDKKFQRDFPLNNYRKNSKGHIALLSSSETKHRNTYSNGRIELLSSSEIEQIKTLTFFLGHSRSGHSIVGSILDAHPHIILANEGKLFTKLQEDLSNETPYYTNKLTVFNLLWKKSVYSTRAGTRSSKENGVKKGYTLSIDGLYQGAFVPPVQVIGDNNAGRTTDLFIDESSQWEQTFLKIKSMVNIPIKVIQVIRNPYDNIATAVLYKSVGGARDVAAVKHNNEKLKVNNRTMQYFINRYFNRLRAVQQIKNKFNLTVLEIHGEDLIENPKSIILSMCQFLGVSCSDDYLETCSNKLFKSESKTRHKIRWSEKWISDVQESIMNFDGLKRYSFDS